MKRSTKSVTIRSSGDNPPPPKQNLNQQFNLPQYQYSPQQVSPQLWYLSLLKDSQLQKGSIENIRKCHFCNGLK